MSSFSNTDHIGEVSILGAGQFGFALAYLLAAKNTSIPVKLYDPIKDYVDSIQATRKHPVFHQGVTLPENVSASSDLQAVIKGSQLIVLAVPGAVSHRRFNPCQQFIRKSVSEWGPLVTNDLIVLNLSKSLEMGTSRLLHDVVNETWQQVKSPYTLHYAALAGGMIAEEVTTGVPIAADIACVDHHIGELLKELFSTPSFRIGNTTDVIGVELAGALKNVLAIGAGLFDGLELTVSSKSAFISMAAREFREIAVALGAKPDTYELGTHAWLGDLLTTCYGPSRNRALGKLIGQGMTVESAIKELTAQRKTAEGYLTTKALNDIVVKLQIHAPFLHTLMNILFNDAPVKESVYGFFVQ